MRVFPSAVAAVLAGSLSLAVIPLAAVSASAADPCSREVVPLPAGAIDGYFTAAEPTGRYQVGKYRTADEQEHHLIWRDGVRSEIVLPDGASFTDVNARGDATGSVPAAPGVSAWQGFRWRNGELVMLPTPAGSASARGVDINARGQIGGQAVNRNGWDNRAVVWSPSNEVRVLPRPDGFNEATVAGIDDDGTVVGTVRDWDFEEASIRAERAIVWFPEGGWRFLPGTADGAFVESIGIRHGAVVGVQRRSETALLWSARDGGATVLATGADPVWGINTSGSVALRRGNENLLYQQGAGFRLLPAAEPVMNLSFPVGVTDDEQIYGGEYIDNVATLVRWTCG